MTLRKKTNAIFGFEFDDQTKWLHADKSEDSSVGIYPDGGCAWMSTGHKLSVIDIQNRNAWANYSFSKVSSNHPVDITCVEELAWDPSGIKASCLLVGISSDNHSQICIFNTGTSRVVRAVQLDNLQIRCMTVINSNTTGLLNSLTDVLSAMDGVIAVGCANGAVILLDLNLQLIGKACDTYADRKYRCNESSPTFVKYVNSDAGVEAAVTEINEIRNDGFSAVVTLIEGEDGGDDFGVTALTYSKETGCLFIGYSSGLWQIWNLTFVTFAMMFECAECTNPVASFSQIEPCEDPRPTIYIWVNHEGTESALPIFNMYSICYQEKRIVPNYGIFYLEFICCNLSFTLDPCESFSDVTGGRFVAAQTFSKTLKRHLVQNMNLPAIEGIQMRLVLITFSLTCSRGDTNSFLCVFDLDQWYKEQMPSDVCLVAESSFIEIVKLSATPLLASSVITDTISLYHTEEPQEIHRAPQALSYEIIVADANGITRIEKLGIQQLWLKNTELIGANSLVHPTKLFHACVSAGLIPSFPAYLDPESGAPTNDEMRSYILSVILDHGLITVIFQVAEKWETGVHGISNCSLTFLFDWVWSSVTAAYSVFNRNCNALFDASGHEIDRDILRRLEHSRIALNRLNKVQEAFCAKYNNNQFNRDMKQRMEALDIIKLYVDQVLWFVWAGLLPEVNSRGLPKSSVKYDFKKLDQYATERRSKLNKIVARLRKVGKAHELPGAGLYLIDHYLHDYPELRKQWEEERGDCAAAYPPASVQSLLRTLRLQSVPKSKKLAILLYGLLDVKNSMAKEENHDEKLKRLADHEQIPDMSLSQYNVVQAIWHLDHSQYEEGLSLLFDRATCLDDLSESVHRAILRLLLYEGQVLLAMRYLHSNHPPLTLPDDIKFEMSVILARKQTMEAYRFQRQHGQLRDALLQQLFSESLSNGEIGHLVEYPLDDYEVKFLDSLLAKNRNQRNDSLRVVMLLTRRKYLEAETLHERLSATSTNYDPVKMDTLNLIVKGLTKQFPPMAKEMYRQSINPELRNHPAFKSRTPLPLSRFVRTIDDKGRLSGEPVQQFCAAAVAVTANFWNSVSRTDAQFKIDKFWTFDDEPVNFGFGDGNSASLSKSSPKLDAERRKRSADWTLGSNKRLKLDEDSSGVSSYHESIAAVIGTPLVKRKSDGSPSHPHTPTSKGQVHSILKSNRTPGTPFSQVDEEVTPKKTLRWDIPGSAPQRSKGDLVKKSLLSTTLRAQTEEPISQPAEDTPSSSYAESIKSRLRSHSSSPAFSKSGNWDEIAEQAKSKLRFAVELPAKRETAKSPSKPKGPSFVSRIEALNQEKELESQTASRETDEVTAHSPVSSITTENESFSSEPLKYDNITIGPEEIGILAELDSPLPTEVLSKKLRSRLRAMATQPAEKSEPLGSGAAESMDVDTSISVAEADSHAKAQEKTCEIESSTKVYKETKSDSIVKAGEGTKPQLTPSNETLSDPHLEEKPVKTTKRAQEKPGPADSPKPNTSSVDEMAKKLPFKEQNLSPFNLESPKAASIVSLSRIRYPEEDDEEGSEDPEEAEIPPVMEFSQMEEGLVMDSYSLADLKDQQNAEKVEEEPVGEALAEDIGQQEISGPPSDKSSSVICLDSESEGEQGNGTQLDYDYDEDSYPTDEDSYPSEEPERRRSFFHDKYNVNDPDAERALPTTADNQQQDEDRRAADVDLYDMDYNEEGIEGDNYDLFDVGRDLQQRPEADDDDEEVEGKKVEQQGPSSSCEGAAGANNADNDVEEAVEDEDQEEEEEGGEDSESESDSDSESDDSAEMISSDSEAGSGSHPTSLAQSQEGIPPTNEGSRETAGDGEIRIELSQEILKRSEVVLTGSAQETAFSSFGSSGETAQRSDVIPVGSSEETVQRSGEALTGSSSQDIMSEDPLGSTGEAEERAKTTEDAAAVSALLCLNDPPVEGNIDAVETSHEVAVVAESANTELSQVPVTPSKETIKASSPPRADDVISMLMSPDQMFFGTSSDARTRESELEICKPSLFSSAGRASFGNQPKAEDHKVEEVQVEKSPDDSNENLDLKLEESDFQCCAAPLPTDAEMTEVAMVEEVGVSSSLGKTPESDRSCASSNVDVPFAIAQTEVAEIKSGDLPLSGEELVVSSAGEVREVITIPQEPSGIVSSEAVGGEGVEEHSHDPSEPEMPETLDQLPEESADVEGSGQSVVEIPKFDDVSSSADSQDKHVNPEIVEMPSESQSHKWDPVQIVITPDEAGALVIDEGNVIPVVTGGLLEIPKPTESVPPTIESAKSDAVNRLKVELPSAEGEAKVHTPEAQEMSEAEAKETERPANVENNEGNSEAVLQGENIVEEKDPKDGGAPEIADPLVLDASSQHKAEDRDMTPAVVPDASADFVVSILEPPTPFKTEEKSEADSLIRPEEERVGSAEMASAGDESVNPNDVAFVGDLSVPMTPTTPRTPLRKSSRLLSRLSTPGRALASDAEVMDSPSVLDVAVVDVELSDDKPQLVDRSVITEPVSKGSRRSSKAPSTGKEESADVESKSEKKRPRQSSNEPEDRKSDVVKPVKKRYRRSSSAEPELESDKMQDVATTSKSNKEATKSIRTPLKASRRSSSEEPPDSAAVKAARKSASQQSDRLDRPNVRHSPRVKPKFDYSEIPSSDSAASSVSGSVPLRAEHSKTRRAISLEPSTEDDPRRQRRASSETAQRPSSRSSSKRSSTEATFDDYEESTDFKKRKTKHSITEPLELKKQASGSKSSELLESQAVPIPRKRGRPRSTLMPTSLASIREVPEDSPKVSRRSSVASSMTEFRNQIVQNWIASSATNIQQRKRLSRNSGTYSTRRASQSTSESDFCVALPPKESSPTESLASVASSSSMVLRSRKATSLDTPTKRRSKPSTKKSKDVPASPARSTRSKRSSSVAPESEDDTILEENEDSGDNQSLNMTSSSLGSVQPDADDSALEESRPKRRQRATLDRSRMTKKK
ncbi:AT hook containing transcription factor 1 [Nesidiocoris tenuis]|uniref:AT hook containing transcription factor 1 n=1 Tax=Nesidiocoris tenuis TaxID=355587 RepID=A0ABN7APX3_9HEMI|nr:AT hook containing transcription factor 1 [Nesidiocoris tenuis]